MRGINVGGKHKVPMSDLKRTFEELGFSNVTTLLNSGNVVFESDESQSLVLRKKIEEKLEKMFGWSIDTIIISQKVLQEMVSNNPFVKITVTPQTRLYVTFLSEEPQTSLKFPYETQDKCFKMLHVSNHAVFSLVIVSEKFNTTDSMKILEKEFGKKVTTRNWNTVVKLAAL